jgi:CRP-like cAMP-binding protein
MTDLSKTGATDGENRSGESTGMDSSELPVLDPVKILGSVPCISALDPEQLKGIGHNIRPKSFDRGEIIVRQGDPTQTLLSVVRGKLKLECVSSTGKLQTVRILGEGECYCVGPSRTTVPSPVTVECLTSAEVLVLGAGEMDQLDKTAGFRQEIVQCLSERLAGAIAGRTSAALDSVREKLAALLLDLALRHGEKTHEGVFVNDLTQDALAHCVGCAREVVSRALLQLQSEGLIRTSRGKILVLDPVKLQRLLTQPST